MATLRVRGRFGQGSLRRENAYGTVSVRPLQRPSAAFGRADDRSHPAAADSLLSEVLRFPERSKRVADKISADQLDHYRDLLACFRSEQMSTQQLLDHVADDPKFKAFLDENLN